MRLERRTIKILVIAAVLIFIVGVITGCVLILRQHERHVHLELIHMAESRSTLISYNVTNESSILKWTKMYDNALADYHRKGPGAESRVVCSPTSGVTGEKQVCDVSLNDYYPCSSSNQYNYPKGGPCVFLKLNKLLNWTPQPYNTSYDLPSSMPANLLRHIDLVSGKPEGNTVWVSCDGVNPADMENIGPVMYFPQPGFPSYYFPYINQEGYLSPLVAVLFEKPKTNIVINIECRAWAKNILYDRNEQQGSVIFQLLVTHS